MKALQAYELLIKCVSARRARVAIVETIGSRQGIEEKDEALSAAIELLDAEFRVMLDTSAHDEELS